MKKFIYHNKETQEIIEIIDDCILQADKQYEKQTGIKPVKANYIGCSIENIDDENTDDEPKEETSDAKNINHRIASRITSSRINRARRASP